MYKIPGGDEVAFRRLTVWSVLWSVVTQHQLYLVSSSGRSSMPWTSVPITLCHLSCKNVNVTVIKTKISEVVGSSVVRQFTFWEVLSLTPQNPHKKLAIWRMWLLQSRRREGKVVTGPSSLVSGWLPRFSVLQSCHKGGEPPLGLSPVFQQLPRGPNHTVMSVYWLSKTF